MRLRCELPATTATTPGVASSMASAASPPAVLSSGLWLKTSSARPSAFASSSRSHASCAARSRPREPPAAVDGVEHERPRVRARGRRRSRASAGPRRRGARRARGALGEPRDHLRGRQLPALRVGRDLEAAAGRAGGQQRVDGRGRCRRPRVGRSPGSSPTTMRLAGGDRVDPRRRRRLALHEQVVVAERRVPRRGQAGRAEPALGRGEDARGGAGRRGRAGSRAGRGRPPPARRRSRARPCRDPPRRRRAPRSPGRAPSPRSSRRCRR